MIRTMLKGILVAATCGFVASSLWYSPVLFGRQFLELSGVVAAFRPSVITVAGEILRNLLLASAISWLLIRHRPTKLNSILAFAGILWLGFPVTLLSGSVMWQNVPLKLAFIHAGDWLIKILLMSVIPWIVIRNVEGSHDQRGRNNQRGRRFIRTDMGTTRAHWSRFVCTR